MDSQRQITFLGQILTRVPEEDEELYGITYSDTDTQVSSPGDDDTCASWHCQKYKNVHIEEGAGSFAMLEEKVMSTASKKSLDHICFQLKEMPIASGWEHPAQKKLEEHLLTYGSVGLHSKIEEPDFMWLLARIDPVISSKERYEIVQAALLSKKLETRDAAVRAVENWATPALFELLRKHEEPETYLRAVIETVLKEERHDEQDAID